MKSPNIFLAVVGFLAYIFLIPGLLLIAAGTTRWRMAWVYIVILLISTLGSRLIVLFRNPDTLQERANFTSSEATLSWDRLLTPMIGIVAPVAIVIVSGLDYRFTWSRQFNSILQVIATVPVILGYGLAVWAMIVNRFFSSVVRIQNDRGQVVVESGPYRLMRHPSYAGSVIAGLSFPVMMGTLWAFIPTVIMIAGIVVRTHLEDNLLQAELPGYQEFSKKIRFKLFPGIW
jgi:protein-S-isoprenylcysteine O-methyltransferase Ste14